MRLATVKPGERGFSLAMVLLVLLTTILGSMAIASRSTSGLMAARSQSSNREARDVAESGATEIISELNQERNRKLLITPYDNWGASQFNPCVSFDQNSNPIPNPPSPTQKALDLKTNNGWRNLISGDTTKQYRLESGLSNKPSATTTTRSPLSPDPTQDQLLGKTKSLFQITVTGKVSNANDGTISTSTITREYEVVPKCCKRSFGRNSTDDTTGYGIDVRKCPPSNSGGLGIVTNINGGTLTTSNNSFNMYDENNFPITRVLCDDGFTACDNQSLNLGGGIRVVPTPFQTTLPQYPGTISTPGPITVSTTSGKTTTVRNYIRPLNGFLEQCQISGNSLTNCTKINTPAPAKCDPPINNQYYCRLSNINSSNQTLILDTSNAKINLYFGSSADPSSTQYLTLGGSGAISHVKCASPTVNTVCTTQARMADVENLNIFVAGPGTLTLKGTSAALAINVFNINGSTDLVGGGGATPNFIGRIWSKNIKVNGSVSMQVPVSAPLQFCPISATGQWTCPPVVNTGAGSSPSADWIARSITHSSNF